MSDRFDWNRPELGDEDGKDGAEANVDEPTGGWPEEDESGWPTPSQPWQQPEYGDTPRTYEPEEHGYRRREELLAAEAEADRYAHRSRDPLARLFPGIPRGVRVTLDWILTIAGAILIVLALKQWVVNPYRIPSSSMEPALNCAKPAAGCLGDSSDRVLACRICLDFAAPSRGDIVVFNTPSEAASKCGEGGTFVKRVIGLPGETLREDDRGFIWVRRPGSIKFVKLKESYIPAQDRLSDNAHFSETWKVPPGDYFMMGDNRSESCDSRTWGAVPRGKLIGIVFFVYWPPDRIGFR
ncbi:MAG TPA: signal peptidase I [Gaiellaceae bacterium]|nr:signal peptidase I [Gaiellaceae bacterium]